MAHNMEKTMKEGLYQPKERAKKHVDQAVEAIEENAPVLQERVMNAVSDIRSQLSDYVGNGREYLTQGENLIKKYPIASVLGACAAGALLAGFFRRSVSKEV